VGEKILSDIEKVPLAAGFDTCMSIYINQSSEYSTTSEELSMYGSLYNLQRQILRKKKV